MSYEKAKIVGNEIIIEPGKKFFFDTFEKNTDSPEMLAFLKLIPKDKIAEIIHNNRGQIMVSFKPLDTEVKLPTSLASKTSGYIYYYNEEELVEVAEALYGENHSGPIYFFDYFPSLVEAYEDVVEVVKEGIKKATDFYTNVFYAIGGAVVVYILVKAFKK